MFITPSTEAATHSDWKERVVKYLSEKTGREFPVDRLSICDVFFYGVQQASVWIRGMMRPRFIPLGLVLKMPKPVAAKPEVTKIEVPDPGAGQFKSWAEYFKAMYGHLSIRQLKAGSANEWAAMDKCDEDLSYFLIGDELNASGMLPVFKGFMDGRLSRHSMTASGLLGQYYWLSALKPFAIACKKRWQSQRKSSKRKPKGKGFAF